MLPCYALIAMKQARYAGAAAFATLLLADATAIDAAILRLR